MDKWGTSRDATATALEDQMNEPEQYISVASKDMDGIHVEGKMLEQRTCDTIGFHC